MIITSGRYVIVAGAIKNMSVTVFIPQKETLVENIQTWVAIVNAMAGIRIVDALLINIDGNFMSIGAWILKIIDGCLLGNRHSEAAWRRAGDTLIRGKDGRRQKFVNIRLSGAPGIDASPSEAIGDESWVTSKTFLSCPLEKNNNGIFVQGLPSIHLITLPGPDLRFQLSFKR